MRSAERIRPPSESRKGAKEDEFNDDLKNTHYSQKTAHKLRSITNDPHKKSRRR